MNKKLQKEIKEKLEQEKQATEEELKKFAKADKNLKDDWDASYPKFGITSSGSQALEEAADEVEEYATRLPIEHSLEVKLKDIKSALGKIEKGNYGKCEKCEKEISEERLKIYPEARICQNCGK